MSEAGPFTAGSAPPPLFTEKKRDGVALYALGLLIAVALHGAAGYGAHNMPIAKKQVRIEMAMIKKPPPPPPEPPKPEPEKPPPKKIEKVAVKQPAPKEPPAPPPPNSTPPKEPPKKPVPILSGVTLESTVEGPSTFHVAVGNTLYDDPNKNKSNPKDVQKYSAPAYREAPAPPTTGGTGLNRKPYKPAPKFQIDTEPEVLVEIKAAYPVEARTSNIEGVVELRVEIWEDGTVRNVKVVRGLGYGLDEAALAAMKRFKFKPATTNGEPVQYTIPRYLFRFELES